MARAYTTIVLHIAKDRTEEPAVTFGDLVFERKAAL